MVADAGPIELIPPAPVFSTGELAGVAQHVRNSLTGELFDNFDLYPYVSNAAGRRWAQRMFVLAKRPDGTLAMLEEDPVSTGRKRNEVNPASTAGPDCTSSSVEPKQFSRV